MGCDCSHNPMDTWVRRLDVPKEGYTHLQHQVQFFIPERHGDVRLMQVYVQVKYIGTPPHMHGGGVYEITGALGFEHIVGSRFGIGYSTVKP